MQNLILHRMVILLFTGQALEKFLLILNVKEKNLDKILPKLVPCIKVSPFGAELNSESNGLVFMDGTYFFKKFLAKSLFFVLAPSW